MTTIERTLLDGLQSPMLAGGSANVLRAWGRARDLISVDQLIDDVDRLDIAVLRQRVGYLLDTLELAHPRLAVWRSEARRGKASRLEAAFPDAPEFSRDWSLSLNGPVAAIHDDWWSH